MSLRERVYRYIVRDDAGHPIGDLLIRRNAYEQLFGMGRISLQDVVPAFAVAEAEPAPARVRVPVKRAR